MTDDPTLSGLQNQGTEEEKKDEVFNFAWLRDPRRVTAAGLTQRPGRLGSQSQLRDSGEVFDHRPWRAIVAALWDIDGVREQLMSLASAFIYRAKSLKVQFKSCSVSYPVNLPEVNSPKRANYNHIIGNDNVFTFYLLFPTETSNVPQWGLTLERIKCAFRIVLVPQMLKELVFPATTTSIGYDGIVKEIIAWEEIIKEWPTLESKSDKESLRKKKHKEKWDNIVAECKPEGQIMITAQAAIAGCLSSKEVYFEDEEIYPGCIWFSGVHAIMTDCSNKIRSINAPKDQQNRLFGSAFYNDFRSKQNSRKLPFINLPSYMKFMNCMRSVIVANLKAGSVLTKEEADLMDAILSDYDSKTATEAKELFETQQKALITSDVLHSYDENLEDVAQSIRQKYMNKETKRIKDIAAAAKPESSTS